MTVFIENRLLLDGFRRGDRDALSAIYCFYIKDIESFLRNWRIEDGGTSSLKNDFGWQKDMIQEIFIKAFSHNARLSFDGIRPYRPYLFAVARTVVIDSLRKHPREILSGFISDDEHRKLEASIEDSDRSEDLYWLKCIQASKEYIATLDSLSQEFVALRFQKELSQVEVSKTLRLSRWKVRSLERRIQEGLRKYLNRAKLL